MRPSAGVGSEADALKQCQLFAQRCSDRRERFTLCFGQGFGTGELGRQRIDMPAGDLHLEVQVRPGCPARHADVADEVALADPGTLDDTRTEFLQVRIQRGMFAVMPDLYNIAVAALPACKLDHATGDRSYLAAHRRRVVDAAVRSVIPEQRVCAAVAEP